MMTIKEDYCSFEVSKLLKEKGFNWECISYYVDNEPNDIKYSFLGETNSTWESRCCSAPTHQMAMAWLREEHKIYIVISPVSGKGYGAILCDVGDFDDFNYIGETDYFFYPEEVVEAGIKYALENLI